MNIFTEICKGYQQRQTWFYLILFLRIYKDVDFLIFFTDICKGHEQRQTLIFKNSFFSRISTAPKVCLIKYFLIDKKTWIF